MAAFFEEDLQRDPASNPATKTKPVERGKSRAIYIPLVKKF